jgi:mannan endo-1,6-alpha-mannosidase
MVLQLRYHDHGLSIHVHHRKSSAHPQSSISFRQTNGDRQHKWKTRVDGLIDKFFERFFPRTINDRPASENVMVEIQCEPKKTCNPDQTSFKAYTSRWLAVTTQLCPWTAPKIMPKLRASAQGAARQCSGLDTGDWCGQDWNSDVWDGFHGVGEQMSALAVIGSMLVDKGARKPTTARTGGTSESDPNAGIDKVPQQHWRKITKADEVGAWIVTVFAVGATLGLAWWMVGD